ncbi:hypothetical protein GCM10009660_23860 [Catellatospora bangladeshensis]
MAWRTASRALGLTYGSPLMTRDTVDFDTPAARATSASRAPDRRPFDGPTTPLTGRPPLRAR